jgi:hypothetical protein
MIAKAEQDGQKKRSRKPTAFRDGPTVVIRVTRQSDEDAENVHQVLRSEAGTRALNSFITDVCSSSKSLNAERNRAGLLQPQVPSSLIDELASLAAKLGVNRTKLLKTRLGLWINFCGGGKRKLRKNANPEEKQKRKDRRFSRPARAFREAGKDLVKTGQLRQLSFDAGTAKSAIERLIKDCNMSKSEFFSALFQSIILQPPPKLMRQINPSTTSEGNSSEHPQESVELPRPGSTMFGIHADTGPLGDLSH